MTRDQFIRTFLGGVPEGSGDAQYLQNKVDIGAFYAIHKGLTTGDAAGVMEGVNASLNFYSYFVFRSLWILTHKRDCLPIIGYVMRLD